MIQREGKIMDGNNYSNNNDIFYLTKTDITLELDLEKIKQEIKQHTKKCWLF